MCAYNVCVQKDATPDTLLKILLLRRTINNFGKNIQDRDKINALIVLIKCLETAKLPGQNVYLIDFGGILVPYKTKNQHFLSPRLKNETQTFQLCPPYPISHPRLSPL